jgi:N-acetylglutamate synthase-like GNAT family acetyltransferase
MTSYQISPIHPSDKPWVTALLKKEWAGPKIVTCGRLHMANEYPGFIAVQDNERVGLITYHMANGECEITSMNSLIESQGIGTSLVEAVKKVAKEENCERLWLITTNDNKKAQRWWRKRGFRQFAVHLNSIEQARLLKPEIPMTGNGGIPIRDEIEMHMMLRK